MAAIILRHRLNMPQRDDVFLFRRSLSSFERQRLLYHRFAHSMTIKISLTRHFILVGLQYAKRMICSATIISLAQGLIDLGHNLYSAQISHFSTKIMGPSSTSSVKKDGFSASSVGKSVQWFKTTPMNISMVLIDWQIAKYVVPLLNKIGLKSI